MAEQRHIEWLLEGVEAWNRRREQEDFRPDFSGADLRDAKLRYADFLQANLTNAVLIKADLRDATISNTDLRDADFSFTNLSGANLLNANLSGADLRQADLSGANLSYSEPWKAELYSPSTDNGTIQSAAGEAQEDKKKIKSIECLLKECRDRKKCCADDVQLYFRGESCDCDSWELSPSVMRHLSFRKNESEMLNELMTRQPEAFSGQRRLAG